jgi:hypothetical protein
MPFALEHAAGLRPINKCSETSAPMGCLAQRNQGGGRSPGDIRFAVYPVGVIVAPKQRPQVSTCTLPSLTTFAHLAISVLMNCLNLSCDPPPSSAP